jgi:hypothetical protein
MVLSSRIHKRRSVQTKTRMSRQATINRGETNIKARLNGQALVREVCATVLNGDREAYQGKPKVVKVLGLWESFNLSHRIASQCKFLFDRGTSQQSAINRISSNNKQNHPADPSQSCVRYIKGERKQPQWQHQSPNWAYQ